MKEETKNWLEMVEYDLITAKQMLETGRYVYVIFMCHLAIEKALKAIVCEQTNKVPPKTHDLIYPHTQESPAFQSGDEVECKNSSSRKPRSSERGVGVYLINFGKVVLPDDLLDFIGAINNAGIVTRYPEDLSKLISSYPKEITREYLDKTSDVIKCIKQDSRLKK